MSTGNYNGNYFRMRIFMCFSLILTVSIAVIVQIVNNNLARLLPKILKMHIMLQYIQCTLTCLVNQNMSDILILF